ncbi:unnamed protein product [Calypogeia fissa]
MASANMTHSVSGMNRLVGVGGPQLASSSRVFNKRNVNTNVKGASSDSGAIRALSGKFCSSSSSSHRGRSQSSSAVIVLPSKTHGSSRRRVGAGSVRCQGGAEFVSGRSSFKTEGGVQFLDIDQSSVGRNSGSAINSLPEGQSFSESLGEVLSQLEADPSSSDIVARPQPVVQGFGDSPFVREFAMDLTAGGGSATSDFDSLSILPMFQPKWVWFARSPEEENMIIDRAINSLIVGSAGVLALTKILTVDHDYWHGWTLVEILQYAPAHNWFAYEEMLKTHPVLAKMMISGTVYSIGDWIAQCYEGKPVLEFNRLRMLRSGLVGFCLHGSMSHFYYQFCEWLFPFKGWWVVPLKVAFDQTFWSALWNSVYFIVVGLLRLESPVSIWKELRQTFFPLLTAGWKLWPAAHLVTYGLVPVEQRLLWVDMVEIVWVTILAMYSNEKAEARIAEAEVAEEMKENIIEGVDDVAADKKFS